jgi:opacity protein-like surface antigen
MKKKRTLKAIVALSVLSMGAAMAQTTDTVRVRQTTTETTTYQNATVAPAPAPAPSPVATGNDNEQRENPPLRRGEFGIRYMPTFYALALRNANNDAIQGKLSMSHGWGMFLGFNFSRHVGIIAEVDYLQINQKYKDRDLNRSVRLNYLNIPVMLSLNTNKESAVNLNFVVGPQFGLNLGGKVSPSGNGNADSLRATVAAKPGDVGLAYGAGLEFALNHEHTIRLDLGFRGYYGFVDMSANQTSNNPDTYNVLVKASRKTYAGYIGLAFLF